MAPIKFEEHIKEKLDKREINPSDKAWAELSSQLDPSNGGTKRRFYLIGIAASIIGLLIVALVYNNNSGPMDNEGGKSVAAPSSVVREQAGELPAKGIVEEQVNIVTIKGASEIVENETTKKVIKVVKDIGEAEFSNEDKIPAVVANNETIELAGKELETKEPNNIINTKIEEVVAQVRLLEENNTTLTDAEVDSLLQQAQKELFSEKIFRDNHSVDAMALLADVEGEMDQSFRDQIFEMLKEGYFKVRTAVAARNN